LPPPLAQALANSAAAIAAETIAGRTQSSGSFNWIPSDKTSDEIVPTHGNFAGPGYGAGKRNPTDEELKNGLVAMVDDPVTGVSREDKIDLIAQPHDLAYANAEKLKESDFAEYLKQIKAADQALIDGTRAMLDKDSRGEIHLTDGERNYGIAMLNLFELKQFYLNNALIIIKNAEDLAKLEAELAKMLLNAALQEIRPYQPPIDDHDTRLHHYPKTDPINKWREDNWKPNDNPRPPTDDTYRIVYIRDPLALDLDGDGVETVATSAGVAFDHNADGIATNTGWINSDDGLLVRDINGNGTIDTGAELFGDNTKLRSGTAAANGFAALADLDSNTDGKIAASDTAFAELKIWRDLNQDGVSQTNELSTLADLGIQSLDTTGARVSVPVPGGSQILTGNYTKADGTTAVMADLNLTQDTFYSQYTDTVEIPAELADLPTIAGMGRLRNLREAAADGYELCAERWMA